MPSIKNVAGLVSTCFVRITAFVSIAIITVAVADVPPVIIAVALADLIIIPTR